MLLDATPTGDAKSFSLSNPQLAAPSKQLELPHFDTDRHAVETKLAALKRKRTPILLKIIELCRESRQVGMIRDELSIAIGRPVHCLTSSVQALLKDGELVEIEARRLTRCGSPAAVIVHRDYRPKGAE